MATLIDTSFLLALAFPKDKNRPQARTAMRNLRGSRIVPLPVLPELFYMVTERVSYAEAVRLFGVIQTTAFQIETLSAVDMQRMQQIMTQLGLTQLREEPSGFKADFFPRNGSNCVTPINIRMLGSILWTRRSWP